MIKHYLSYTCIFALALNFSARAEHHHVEEVKIADHHNHRVEEVKIKIDEHCHDKNKALAFVAKLAENNAYWISFGAAGAITYAAAQLSGKRINDEKAAKLGGVAAVIWLGGGYALRQLLRAYMSVEHISKI
jgi:hypothetical protein